jgi:hypothetical protein
MISSMDLTVQKEFIEASIDVTELQICFMIAGKLPGFTL